ncbi:MAG: GIY-YIG nuclease family protein [Candidatus Uhrbacteria bacterium]|nr:GIY-YIG nuclease family protein [Candidatus Uhrbacteria bacterium]
MNYVYLIQLCDGRFYTGSTPDLKLRFQQHSLGYVISTRDYRPIKLVWYCAFPNRIQARQFEKYLKSGSGQAFRNKR